MLVRRRAIVISIIGLLEVTGTLTIADWDWKPANWTNEFLKCPHSCLSKQDIDICCACNSKNSWELTRNPEEIPPHLYVEYVSIKNAAVLKEIGPSKSTKRRVIHVGGRLFALPMNICNFTNIVLLDLTANSISDMKNISCLKDLEILMLGRNKLTHLSNSTLRGLSKLRTVDMSDNKIKIIDPNTLIDKSLHIFAGDFSGNNMKEIDITNIVMKNKLYCRVSYERTNFSYISNKLNWKVNIDDVYGSGMVSFDKNPPMEFPLYNLFGFAISDFPTLFKILPKANFYFGSIAFRCDCKMEPIFAFAEPFIKKADLNNMFGDFPNFICPEPERLKGVNATIFINKANRDMLTCELEPSDPNSGCPKFCHCLDQPSQNKTIVNCTNKMLHSLPKHMPKGLGAQLELHMDNNRINTLDMRDYLHRVSFLDLSNNHLSNITEEAAKLLSSIKTLKLRNHSLTTFPKQILKLDPGNVDMGQIPIRCTCSDTWIDGWMQRAKDNGTVEVLCELDSGKIIPLRNVTMDILGCFGQNTTMNTAIYSLSSVLFVTVLAGIIAIFFGTELRIIFRNVFNEKHRIQPRFNYDIFLSFDDENDDIRPWVTRTLMKRLTDAGYNVFNPCMDILPGDIREKAIVRNLNMSRTLLVIVTKSYFYSESCLAAKEFRYFVPMYFRNISRRLIVIDFDNMSTFTITDKNMKAFYRLRQYISVYDRNNKLYKVLLEKLDIPLKDRIGT